MSLRAMLTAPRTVASLSGNSSRPSFDAEYTDAPSSLTTNTCTSLACVPSSCVFALFKQRDFMNDSVSRLAVPLPIAMASISYCLAMYLIRSAAFSPCCFPPCLQKSGNIASWCSRLPCASRQTTLHPVRKPGSMPIVRFCPSGAARSSWRRLVAKTFMASLSACSLLRVANSVSIDGLNSRL